MNPFTSGNTGLQKQDEGRQNWERSTGISLNREGLLNFEKVYKTYSYGFIFEHSYMYVCNNTRN